MEKILIIKSLKVEEGFFNNLNLDFSNGLNVLVGGRGVGKTSVIELLRFGLGAKGVVEENNNNVSHALSILKSTGQVCIELQLDSGEIISVTRTAQDKEPWASKGFVKPIIFSQTEIESISLNKDGRMALIDSFIPEVENKKIQINHELNELKSLCTQFDLISKEYNELLEHVVKLPELQKKELFLSEQHSNIQEKNFQLLENQDEIKELQDKIAHLSVDVIKLETFKELQYRKIDSVNNILNINQDYNFLKINENFDNELSTLIFNTLVDDERFLKEIYERNIKVVENIEEKIISISKEKMLLENKSRANRTELESKMEGAGSILSELGRIREQIAKINNVKEISNQKNEEKYKIYAIIQQKLVDIYKIKESIFNDRSSIVKYLNESLSPMIKVNIDQYSDISNYAVALENSLRGSGLKYKELLKNIAERISPAWLFYYSITEKYEDFARSLDIPVDRATRLLGYLSDINLGEILASNIMDTVSFSLLDHGQYKPINELSIGQRCTVALSIILENKSRILIVDQPEDHLDNEFIVNTLIKSIKKRAILSQTIISSHNANIPVLGGAENIINLESNGRKGFVRVSGALNRKEVKNAIESIMEGGKEAFQLRSSFYKE